MRKGITLWGLVVPVLAACADGPSAPPVADPQMAAVTETINERVTIDDFPVFVPCAAGGAGEAMELAGELHFVTHITTTANGSTDVSHVNPQGVTGIGETTGTQYQGTGVGQVVTTQHAAETTTIISNFRIIGHGPGNNLLVHMVVHVTVTPTGKTTTVEHISIDCK